MLESVNANDAAASIKDAAGAIENSSSFGNYLIHGIDEIILPDAISYWPTAPGWQVLGVLVGIVVIIRAIQRAKHWWRNRYRREALRQLDQVQKQAGKQLQDVVAVLPHFIKVTALHAYPRQEVAALNGKPWLSFLDAHYSGPAFSEGIGEKLLALAYLPREQWQLNDQESNELINMVRRWIALHSEATDV